MPGEPQPPPVLTPGEALGWHLATLTRVGYVGFFVVLLAWIASLPSPWFTREVDDVVSFNYHPLAMGVSFVVLVPEALLAYADLEGRRGVLHASAKRIHAGLNGGAALLLVLGLVAIFANHDGHGIPPLYSAHSWMGMATACVMGCQAVAGAAVYLSPAGTWGAPGTETRASLMPWHRFFGVSTLVMGVATCSMGFVEKQGFLKCAPDPKDKFCKQLQLPNVLVLIAACVATTAVRAVYVRWMTLATGGTRDEDPESRAALLRRRRDGDAVD